MALQLHELEKCPSNKAVNKQLKSLPGDLNSTYEQILLRIPEHFHDHLKKFLQWLAFSIRPMTIEEIAETVTVDLDAETGPSYQLDQKYIDPKDIFTACSSLITTSDGMYKAITK